MKLKTSTVVHPVSVVDSLVALANRESASPRRQAIQTAVELTLNKSYQRLAVWKQPGWPRGSIISW
jgi:hypothetical protein